MGPLLTRRPRLLATALATALAAALLLAGCEPECNAPTTRRAPLAAPYDQFFNQLPACGSSGAAPVAASSSTGLTDSYADCLRQYTEFATNAQARCENTLYEGLRVNTLASLYGFSFAVEVEQHPDGPRLQVRDQSPNSVGSQQRLTYDLATRRAELTYFVPPAGNALSFDPAPTVSELTNFQSGGRTFAQVWRISNPLHAAQGRPTAATVLFIDRGYGLIRFEQRDGTVWTLNR